MTHIEFLLLVKVKFNKTKCQSLTKKTMHFLIELHFFYVPFLKLPIFPAQTEGSICMYVYSTFQWKWNDYM